MSRRTSSLLSCHKCAPRSWAKRSMCRSWAESEFALTLVSTTHSPFPLVRQQDMHTGSIPPAIYWKAPSSRTPYLPIRPPRRMLHGKSCAPIPQLVTECEQGCHEQSAWSCNCRRGRTVRQVHTVLFHCFCGCVQQANTREYVSTITVRWARALSSLSHDLVLRQCEMRKTLLI